MKMQETSDTLNVGLRLTGLTMVEPEQPQIYVVDIIEWNRRRAGYPPEQGKRIDMRLIEKKREEMVR